MYYVYMLRCIDDSIYTGITNDITRRMSEHFKRNEKCAKYTYNHKAKKLECVYLAQNRSDASKLEYYIKKLSKLKKEQIIFEGNIEIFLGKKIDVSKYIRYNINL